MSKATKWLEQITGPLILISAITWGFMAAMGVYWAFDDSPPIKLTSYTVSPAYPGGTMLAVADVDRNLARNCDATYSRRFVDSRGAIHAIEPDTSMGANSIRALDARNPGKLIFTAPIPEWAPPGKGMIVTPMRYTCNPWHFWRPITFSLEMQAEVLTP